ncbi:hypothetical protein HHK36_020216 [Tetracentron sinense]|uniref:Integrase zinc-binding domain-containing protein n=1 Tax=Tetracentron sinense TaxID=13715 RepID=A0A834YR84_TETSI|nr:hypothetical protein HHK36_020216 [Tetracentron sinense]
MAEGTRFSTIEKTLASSKTQQDESKIRADLQEQKIDDIGSKLDRLLSMGEKNFTKNLHNDTECSAPPRWIPFGSPQQFPDNNIQVRSIMVEFPKFEGQNVSGWLFKANKFFSYNNTAPENRIFMTSFYMEGEALVWFQDALDSGVFSSWEAFVKAIQIRKLEDEEELTEPGSLMLLTFPDPTWVADIKQSYTLDPKVQQLLTELQNAQNPKSHYSLRNGLLLYKGRIYVGQLDSLRTRILNLIHDSPAAGHSGYQKTLHRAKHDFYWLEKAISCGGCSVQSPIASLTMERPIKWFTSAPPLHFSEFPVPVSTHALEI